MSQTSESSWKLILATAVALGMTVLVTVMVTLRWVDDEDEGAREELGAVEEVIGETQIVEPVEGTDEELTLRELYELPEHSGRLVTEVEERRFGLPQLEAVYEVDIRGDLATVVVKQRFANPTGRTVEPVYEFPLYEQAAVYAMSMQIGDRRIDAEIKRKEEAREIYEEARRQGRQAALLEQDRPNLFVQRVANVQAGQEVEITLRYTHRLPKSRGLYHLAVPMGVPERYTPQDMSGNVLVGSDGADDPGASAGGAEGRSMERPQKLSLTVRIDGGVAVSDIESTSHRIQLSQLAETVYRVELDVDEDAAKRHFLLGYRLGGEETALAVSSYWHGSEEVGYFDLLIEPPAEVAASQVADREVVFLLDRSGSMQVGRMEAAKELVTKMLDHLRPDDHFRIIVFDNSTFHFSNEPTRATPANVAEGKRFIRDVTARGGTEIVLALQEALTAEEIEDALRMVVVITDVAVSNDFAVIRTIRENIGAARLYGVGVGSDVNRYLLEEIGRSGRGFSTQFQTENSQKVIDDAVRRLQSPVLTDISVEWGTLMVSEATPWAIPDVFEGGSVRVQGRYHNPGTHEVRVRGMLGGEPVEFVKEVEFASSAHDGEALRLGWARQKIRDEMHILTTPQRMRPEAAGSEEEIKERITELGLQYQLTTQWTSFVAADIEEPAPQEEAVERLRMPAGAAAGGQRMSRTMSRPRPSSMRGGTGRGMGSIADREGAAGRPMIEIIGGGGAPAPEPEPRPAASPRDMAPPEVSVELNDVEIEGEMERAELERVFRARRNQLKFCYEREVQKTPTLAGEVEMRFAIAGGGSVDSVRIEETTLGNEAVETCVVRVIERLNFPRPEGGEKVQVRISLEFLVE